MSQWYHRNGLKNTSKQNFYLPLSTQMPSVVRLCCSAKDARKIFLDLISDPSSSSEDIHKNILEYLSVIQGFVYIVPSSSSSAIAANAPALEQSKTPTNSSKLRNMISFKWSNSVTGTIEQQSDMVFEMCNILYEYSLWLMKHASWLASQDNVDMESAKKVHSSLRRSAGILEFIQTHLIPQLTTKPEAGSDLDGRVITAYIATCQAEAQEVTIARAIELKHSSSLISALANQTAQLFQQASAALSDLDRKIFGKWLIYLQLKASVYLSYAYCYLGDNLLQMEKCGEAVRALQESEKYLEKAIKIGKEYGKAKMPIKASTNAKIDEHLFFRNLRVLVNRIKEKCERENGFIFHQKVPPECPSLELKATHGLVTPEDFTLPKIDDRWSPSTYSAFDIPTNPKDKKNKKKDSADSTIEEIVEKPIKDAKDQKNESGCSIQ